MYPVYVPPYMSVQTVFRHIHLFYCPVSCLEEVRFSVVLVLCGLFVYHYLHLQYLRVNFVLFCLYFSYLPACTHTVQYRQHSTEQYTPSLWGISLHILDCLLYDLATSLHFDLIGFTLALLLLLSIVWLRSKFIYTIANSISRIGEGRGGLVFTPDTINRQLLAVCFIYNAMP